jgi:sRNA-binding carbon storage regulator CsrA
MLANGQRLSESVDVVDNQVRVGIATPRSVAAHRQEI